MPPAFQPHAQIDCDQIVEVLTQEVVVGLLTEGLTTSDEPLNRARTVIALDRFNAEGRLRHLAAIMVLWGPSPDTLGSLILDRTQGANAPTLRRIASDCRRLDGLLTSRLDLVRIVRAGEESACRVMTFPDQPRAYWGLIANLIEGFALARERQDRLRTMPRFPGLKPPGPPPGP